MIDDFDSINPQNQNGGMHNDSAGQQNAEENKAEGVVAQQEDSEQAQAQEQNNSTPSGNAESAVSENMQGSADVNNQTNPFVQNVQQQHNYNNQAANPFVQNGQQQYSYNNQAMDAWRQAPFMPQRKYESPITGTAGADETVGNVQKPVNADVNPYNLPQSSYMPQQNVPQYNAGAFAPVQKQKKSIPTGLIAFLVSAAVVLGLCICLTVVAVSSTSTNTSNNSAGNSGGYGNSSPFSGGYDDSLLEDSDALDESDLIDTTDENGPQIELEKQPADIFSSDKYTAKYAYDKSKSSVVGVLAYSDKEKTEIGSQGTGIIISSNGYIVTNSHVIDDSKTKYRVTVSIDGEEFDAQVTGYDSRTDIAVLKIDKTGLTPASFADSSEVEVGQEVVAIGNPGGIEFSNSVTQGIVSALDRDVSHGNVSYIQTDAAINPGNSGGPLLNMSGQVIGITTIKIVNTSYEGMGFAIPSQQAVSVIDSIIKKGYVEGRVRMGLTGNEINATYSSYYNLPVGIYVVTVDEDGPLADGDIYPEDVITKIDDVEITSFSVLYKELEKHKAGDVVTLTYCCPEDNYEYEYTIDVVLEADTAQ